MAPVSPRVCQGGQVEAVWPPPQCTPLSPGAVVLCPQAQGQEVAPPLSGLLKSVSELPSDLLLLEDHPYPVKWPTGVPGPANVTLTWSLLVE